MKLFWTLEAIEDRWLIYEFIEADKPLAALDFDDVISEQSQLLLTQPGLGRPGRVKGTREWVVHSNYMLIYDQRGEDLRILRVLHAAKQWPAKR